MINIAILGGAFDPITNGHVKIVEVVLNSNCADEVWIMPCYRHKYNKQMVTANDRLNMCKLAVGLNTRIKVSSFEIRYRFTGEVYNMFKFLQSKLSRLGTYSFIIGTDNANTIDQWFNYQELLTIVRFIVVSRQGEIQDPKVDWYLKRPHIYLQSNDIPEISSTQIRNAIKSHDDVFVRKNVNPEVLDYVHKNKFYIS